MLRKPLKTPRPLAVIGLMSGTSFDGVDATLIETDGETIGRRGRSVSTPYPPAFRRRLREGLRLAAKTGRKRSTAFFRALERELTLFHVRAVKKCLAANKKRARDIALIGFHGQTVFHDPKAGLTWQLGDGKLLARLCGINVVADFRANDVKHGGEGAPLAPLYHGALFGKAAETWPIAVLNIGGVANVTWLSEEKILAFDCGPGNALLDDWVWGKAGRAFDRGGKLAAKGKAKRALVTEWLKHPYFRKKPPKSLDRGAFRVKGVEKLSLEDGAATLAAFTAGAIAKARDHFPRRPRKWVVTGGGRRNPHLMKLLAKRLKASVKPIEAYGFDGDALEAEAFGFLAVRSLKGMPLSLPATTGVKMPVTGGRLYGVRSR